MSSDNLQIETTPAVDQNISEIQDKVPEIKVSIPDTKPVALLPNVLDPVPGYRSQRQVGRGAFQNSEYNLIEIGRVEDTEGYVRQAFSKKVGLMFKEGWDLIGKNPRTIKYVKTRLAQIAQATKIPTNTLLRNIGSNVIRKSNAFVLKVRKTEASGGRVRTIPGSSVKLEPVAGYFPLPAETMKFRLSGSNVIKSWKQEMPSGDDKEYSVRNVIHVTHDRKDGFVFGTPLITPVLDDIRALRKIEENIELLIYQHLFPLFQYIVGTETSPAGMTETGEREIDVVKREIMYMPTEGGIVTPERHQVKAIGAEGRAIRAEGYVDHFKKRVFAGLGLSAVDYGEGETSNKSTADNMSRNLVDSVKDLQQVVEDAINLEIINELLLESTFGPDVLDEENVVRLKFKEIDVDAQIKKETHAADQFNKDIIDHDEARRRMGLEPWIVPSPDEVQSETDTPETYPQWHKSRWKLFELPKLLIQALDEPWSPAARAAAADSSLPMTEKGNEESAKQEINKEVQLEKERTKAKIAIAKAKPATRATTRDGFLNSTYKQTKKDIVARVSIDNTIDHDWIASLIRTQLGTTIKRLQIDQLIAFRRGYSSVASVETRHFAQSASLARVQFQTRAENYIIKLTENIISSLKRNVHPEVDDKVSKTRAVFDALEYRTLFIEDVEIGKAKNLGIAVALRDTEADVTVTSNTVNDAACPACKSKDGEPIDLSVLIIDLLPPHHASCSCAFIFTNNSTQLQDKVIEPETVVEGDADKPLPEVKKSGDVASCPKCGKTAIRTKGTADSFTCNACRTIFKTKQKKITKTPDKQDELPEIRNQLEDNEGMEDFGKKNRGLGPKSKQTAYEKCKSKIKARLRGLHPDWSDGDIMAAAEAACIHIISLEVEEEGLLDGTEEDCVLKVKKSLRKQHPNWGADKIKSSAYAICRSKRKGN